MTQPDPPWGALPAPLKREPLAMTESELADALRERIEEFNVLSDMARERGLSVGLTTEFSLFGGRPKLVAQIAKML